MATLFDLVRKKCLKDLSERDGVILVNLDNTRSVAAFDDLAELELVYKTSIKTAIGDIYRYDLTMLGWEEVERLGYFGNY